MADLKESVLFRKYPANVIPQIPIVDGQVLFETMDKNGRIYIDDAGTRKTIGGSYLPSRMVTFTASGWSATAPFKQTVIVSGVTKYDEAIPTLNKESATNINVQRNLELNFNYITYYDIEDGRIVATAPFVKPTVDLKVNFVGQ